MPEYSAFEIVMVLYQSACPLLGSRFRLVFVSLRSIIWSDTRVDSIIAFTLGVFRWSFHSVEWNSALSGWNRQCCLQDELLIRNHVSVFQKEESQRLFINPSISALFLDPLTPWRCHAIPLSHQKPFFPKADATYVSAEPDLSIWVRYHTADPSYIRLIHLISSKSWIPSCLCWIFYRGPPFPGPL